MKLGSLDDTTEWLRHLDSIDDDDDDDDYGRDSDRADEGNRRYLNPTNEGFMFTAVRYADDDTYKCVATKGNKTEVMYFYMHVDETFLLRGITERYITFYDGERLVLPCTPINKNVTVKLYLTSDVEILPGTVSSVNRSVTYDNNNGFTIMSASVSDAGKYRCDATLGSLSQTAYFYVYFNNERLLEKINDTDLHVNKSGSVLVPCVARDSNVKLELYTELAPATYRLVPQTRGYFTTRTEYIKGEGFNLFYSSRIDSDHLMCLAKSGEKHETVFYSWHGNYLLHPPDDQIIVADTGDKAVLPCRPTDADVEVTLFIGASSYKLREIKMGHQRHRNQVVTFDPAVGFTLSPVSHLDTSWYRCKAMSDTAYKYTNFYLEVRVPPRITKTNLNVSSSLVQSAEQNMTIYCNSEGVPHPDTLWFKDGKPLETDTGVELTEGNQSLVIKRAKSEHAGTYTCVVTNEMDEVRGEGNVIITVGEPIITRTNLNKSQNIITKLKGNLTIFCESVGEGELQTVWFKDGKPVITDDNVELGERNQSLTIKVVNVQHTGLYSCNVSNSVGEVQSEGEVTLEGTEPVLIPETNLNVTVSLEAVLGESLIIFCKVQGKPQPKIVWSKDEVAVVPDNRTMMLAHGNQELYIIPVKYADEGTYRCVARNGLTEAQAEGNVTVTEKPKIVDTNLNVSRNIETEVGTDLVLFCKAEGNPPPNITWFKDDKPLDVDSTVELKENNQTLTIKGVKQEAKGMYRCKVHNNLAEVQMAAAVDVTDEPASSTSAIITSVVCVLVVLAMIVALVVYVQRGRLLYSLRHYMQLRGPRQDTEDHSDFSDRLQEEYFGRSVGSTAVNTLMSDPRSHGGDSDVGNLIVSECLPDTSARSALDFQDDFNNINSVNTSNEIGSFPSLSSEVRFVEMKNV